MPQYTILVYILYLFIYSIFIYIALSDLIRAIVEQYKIIANSQWLGIHTVVLLLKI